MKFIHLRCIGCKKKKKNPSIVKDTKEKNIVTDLHIF